jgi:hypothetical protein
MTSFQIAFLLVALLFGSALTIQLFVFPPLMARQAERSAMSRICGEILKKHQTLALLALVPAAVLFYTAGKTVPAILSTFLAVLNAYQRLWISTRIHLVKQPIGVQDLIQPDNALREEFNRLQKQLYLLFRIHLLLLLIDLIVTSF